MVSIPLFTTVNYRKESENYGSTLVFNVFPVYIVRARLKFNVFAISFDARAHYITKRIVLKLFTRLWWISNYLFFFFSTETFFYFFSYCIFLYLFLESLSFLFFFFSNNYQIERISNILSFISGCLYRYTGQSGEIYSALEYLTHESSSINRACIRRLTKFITTTDNYISSYKFAQTTFPV